MHNWRWIEKIPLPHRRYRRADQPIELGQVSFANNISCLYPTYIRGEAYLPSGQGSAAAAEF
jgi:hypothetical protein